MKRRASLNLFLGLAVLTFTEVASASAAKQYVLKHPKREHCRAHYVKKVERVKKREHGKLVKVKETFCVYQALKPAPTPGPAPAPAPPAPAPIPTSVSVNATSENFIFTTPPDYLLVSAGLFYGTSATQLVGQPITYTITDATTGQTVGSFAGLSNLYASCTVVVTFNAGVTETFTGEAVPPHAGCALAPVSIPVADAAMFTGSFAGNSTYAPSVSPQASF